MQACYAPRYWNGDWSESEGSDGDNTDDDDNDDNHHSHSHSHLTKSSYCNFGSNAARHPDSAAAADRDLRQPVHRGAPERLDWRSCSAAPPAACVSPAAGGVWTRRPDCCRVKLIDFGGATFGEDPHCSLINTRQYRAPEVILRK